MPGGRPATYDKVKVIEHVLEQLANGRALSSICEDDAAACSYGQWFRWQLADEELREAVAHAREAGATKLLEEIITISDDKTEDAHSRRVRIHARERYAAMLSPQRFGQKVDVTSGGKALPAPVAADRGKIDALLALALARRSGEQPMIDVTPSVQLLDILD